MMLPVARALRLMLTVCCAAPLAGCCGYLITSCPTTQTSFDSAGYALSSLGNARDQASGLLQAANTAFKPEIAQSFAAQYTAFGSAATVWQNDAAAVLRSSAAFSQERNDAELAAISRAAQSLSESVEAAAKNPQNFSVTYVPLPANAIIDAETGAPPIVAAARAFSDDVATGTALMRAVAPSVIDGLAPGVREAIAVAIVNTSFPPASQN
jgi:hypothetical protein